MAFCSRLGVSFAGLPLCVLHPAFQWSYGNAARLQASQQQQHRAITGKAGDGNHKNEPAGQDGDPPHLSADASNTGSQSSTGLGPAAADAHADPVAVASATSEKRSGITSSSRSSAGIAATNSTAQESKSSTSNSGGIQLISPGLLAEVSAAINRLTGYEAIDSIKGGVGAADQQLQDVKRALHVSKANYDAQLAKQGQLHREVTALLQRKSSWVPADVARFTQLYAAEHETEQAVAAAKARYSQLSDEAELLQLKLVDLIRERYQQEQLWSDKIRRASTWWTWGLMGLHFASFVLVYTFLEPRKRAALQAAVEGMLTQHMVALDGKLMQLAPTAAPAPAADMLGGAAEAMPQEGQDAEQLQLAVPARKAAGSQQQAAASLALASQQQQHESGQQHDMQQVMLQELQLLRQQIAHLQQAFPAAGVNDATDSQQQQQKQQGRSWWHLPGSGWAAGQFAAAGRSARSLWQDTKQKAQQALAQYRTLHGGQDESAHQGSSEPPGTSSSSSSSSTTSNDTQQQREQPVQETGTESRSRMSSKSNKGPVQQEAAATAADPMSHQRDIDEQQPPAQAEGAEQAKVVAIPDSKSLLQQLQAGSSLLEVTRGQLAVVAAGAAAAGAAVAAAVVVSVFKGGGGAAGSSAGTPL